MLSQIQKFFLFSNARQPIERNSKKLPQSIDSIPKSVQLPFSKDSTFIREPSLPILILRRNHELANCSSSPVLDRLSGYLYHKKTLCFYECKA